MILYFSTTGNTKYVAEEIGRLIDDTVIDIRQRVQQNDYSEINSDKPFVICSPVYVSELPRFFTAFIRRTPFTGNNHIYFIHTSGGYSGISNSIAKMLAAKKRMKFMGSTNIDIVQNYIACNTFRIPEKEEIEKLIAAAAEKIPPIADSIKSLEKLDTRHVFFLEFLITMPVNPIWCHTMQGTKGFYTTDQCGGCGKCCKICPLNAISLDENNKPKWSGKQCAHCMGCIQNCPKQAIEYKNKTQGKMRYHFDDYKYVVKQ